MAAPHHSKSATPPSLAEAVSNNDIAAVKALINNDADLRPANWYDTPVLVVAATHGFFEIVQLLVTARANVNTGYERLPLHSAAENGHLSVVRYLMTVGAYPNAQDSRGYTPLMAAAAKGQLAVVQFLIEQVGYFSTAFGERAMTLAIQGGHLPVHAFLQKKVFPPETTEAARPVAQPTEPKPMPTSPKLISVMEENIENAVNDLKSTLFKH